MIEVIRRKESVAARFLEKQNIPFSFNLQNKMKERFVMVTTKKNEQACTYIFIFS